MAGSGSVQQINAMLNQNIELISCKLEPTRYSWRSDGPDLGLRILSLISIRVRELETIKKNIFGRSDNMWVSGVDLFSSNCCTYGRVISL
jgi:hypothetical protein